MRAERSGQRREAASLLGGEDGMALLITMLALFIVALTGIVISRIAQTEIEIAGNYRSVNRAFYAADGGAEYGLNELLELGRAKARFPTAAEMAAIAAPALAGIDYSTFTVAASGAQTTGPLTSGFYQGLVAVTQPFTVTATAATTVPPVGTATVAMTADFDIIPIFQFAIFYEEDLEILPGADMWLNGRVHGNENIYIGSGATLTVDSTMTAAQDIFNFRKDDPAALMNGIVQIRDSTGAFQAMAGLDSTDPDWVTEALDRWDGNVRSGEHDVERLNLTIEDPTDPHRIIEPADVGDSAADQDAKMWYDADLRIINGQGFDNAGNPVSLVDPLTGTSAVAQVVIWDAREQKHMLATEVDIDKLGRVPGYPGTDAIVYVGGYEPGGTYPNWNGGAAGVGPPPWAGYATPWSNAGTSEFAVKLTNGGELANALTVVSDNPTYIRGDYNTVDKKGAAVIADAVTVLSNRWGDVNGDGDTTDAGDGDLAYSEQVLNDRNAWSTTVNAAVMLGNTDSVPGTEYNGGVENVMRFLERWSGDTLTYRGSIIDLWNSTKALGTWIYGDPIYTAPDRAWSFDTDFLDPAKLPPGTPNVYTIRVIGWEREH
jgi:Tfp pilus assembly protein PilX